MSEYGTVVGGKLKLKKGPMLNSRKKRKKRKEPTSSHDDKTTIDSEGVIVVNGLTETQKSHKKVKERREEEEIRNQVSKTYRERVEEYNERLSRLTEHHDIPRISAAGNG